MRSYDYDYTGMVYHNQGKCSTVTDVPTHCPRHTPRVVTASNFRCLFQLILSWKTFIYASTSVLTKSAIQPPAANGLPCPAPRCVRRLFNSDVRRVGHPALVCDGLPYLHLTQYPAEGRGSGLPSVRGPSSLSSPAVRGGLAPFCLVLPF